MKHIYKEKVSNVSKEGKLKRTYNTLLLVILIAGVIDLAMQILAGRYLTPAFGSSVYTWGSVIGIFMLTLSVGYHIGGKFAKKANNAHISSLLLAASFFIGLIVYVGDKIIAFVDSLPLGIYAAIPAVLLLFGPPSFLFGMLTPFAVELSRKESKGEAAGQIFTIGTIGSIIGAFTATFILIPLFATKTTFLLLAFCTIALSIGFSMPKKRYLIIVLLILLVAISVSDEGRLTEGELVYTTQTPYQQLEVRDVPVSDVIIRSLYLDGQLQSGWIATKPYEYVYVYTTYFEIPFVLNDNISNVLFIGGGGFTGPKILANRGLNVTVVELDPTVARVAKEYFAVNESMMDIHVQDGRDFLQDTDQMFDLIVLDAYRKDRIPFHLATREFYELVYAKLRDDGIVLTNIISFPTGEKSLFFRTSYNTMKEVFPTTAFRTLPEDTIQNMMLMGTKGRDSLTAEQLKAAYATFTPVYPLDTQLDTVIAYVPTDDVTILVDGRAPVDSLVAALASEEFILS